jgi:hypothetical protein
MAMKGYHVAPDSKGWSIKGEGDERVSQLFPNKLAAVSAARRLARTAGTGDVVVHRPDGRIESVESLAKGHLEDVLHLYEKEKLNGFLDELSAKTGESPSEIMLKALALYKAAMEAVEQGKAVGIANEPSQLEAEFVGF